MLGILFARMRLPSPTYAVVCGLLACGDGGPGASSLSAGTVPSVETTSTTEATSAAPTTTEPTTVPTTADADSTTASTTEIATTTTDDTTTADVPNPWNGEPLPPHPPGEWQWVPMSGSRCRSGPTTGLAVRYGTSDNLVIVLDGQGLCFNPESCTESEPGDYFGEANFGPWAESTGKHGVLSNNLADNPVADWNIVFLPDCTQDMQAGKRHNEVIPGYFGPQQFVGRFNYLQAMLRIVPTFPDAPKVLIVGRGSGGYGALIHFEGFVSGWPKASFTLVDDGGPMLTDTYWTPCQQSHWRELWVLGDSLPADCSECNGPDGGNLSALGPYLAAKFPQHNFGLISGQRDLTVADWYGFGLDDCKGALYDGPTFQSGLNHLRSTVLAPFPNWRTYFVFATTHGYTTLPAFSTTTVKGTRMADWLADLIAGTAEHVAP